MRKIDLVVNSGHLCQFYEIVNKKFFEKKCRPKRSETNLNDIRLPDLMFKCRHAPPAYYDDPLCVLMNLFQINGSSGFHRFITCKGDLQALHRVS